jgi:hypothetical protein
VVLRGEVEGVALELEHLPRGTRELKSSELESSERKSSELKSSESRAVSPVRLGGGWSTSTRPADKTQGAAQRRVTAHGRVAVVAWRIGLWWHGACGCRAHASLTSMRSPVVSRPTNSSPAASIAGTYEMLTSYLWGGGWIPTGYVGGIPWGVWVGSRGV